MDARDKMMKDYMDFLYDVDEIDEYHRPMMRVTKKVFHMISDANNSVFKIVEEIVMSAVTLRQIKPTIVIRSGQAMETIPQGTEEAMTVLGGALHTTNSLSDAHEDEEGSFYFPYPETVKEDFERAIQYLQSSIADMKDYRSYYEAATADKNPEEPGYYVEGYISSTIGRKIEEYEKTIEEIEAVLDVFGVYEELDR